MRAFPEIIGLASAKNSIVEWLPLCDWPSRRVEPAVNWQRQAVQHGCGVAQEKTNDRGDVFTFGKSSEQDPGEHWAAFGGIAPGSLTHAG